MRRQLRAQRRRLHPVPRGHVCALERHAGESVVAPCPRCGYGHASSDVEPRESRWYMLAVPPADDEQQRGAVRYAYDS